MEFSIQDPGKLDIFIQTLKTVKPSYDVLNVMCRADTGMVIQNLDKSHVCLCHLKLPPSWFSTFRIDHEGGDSFDFAVDTASWVATLQHKLEGHAMVVQVAEDVLTMQFVDADVCSTPAPKKAKKVIGKKKKKDAEEAAVAEEDPEASANAVVPAVRRPRKTYKLALRQFEYEQLGVPEMDSEVEATLSAKQWTDLVHEMCEFGDNVTIRCDQDQVTFFAKDELREATVAITTSDLESYGIVENEVVEAAFKATYLQHMSSTRITPSVSFQFSAGRPIELTYALDEEVGASLSFFVAPFVTDN